MENTHVSVCGHTKTISMHKTVTNRFYKSVSLSKTKLSDHIFIVLICLKTIDFAQKFKPLPLQIDEGFSLFYSLMLSKRARL